MSDPDDRRLKGTKGTDQPTLDGIDANKARFSMHAVDLDASRRLVAVNGSVTGRGEDCFSAPI